jgi:hypothetical protein
MTFENDKGDQRVKAGFQAERRRAVHSIKRILDMDDQNFSLFVSRLNTEEKARYDQELADYQVVCARMAGRYQQWSSQLLLEAPQIGEAEPLHKHYKHSSLIAGYTNLIASRQVRELSTLRKQYLEDLRSCLRPDEIERFDTMLQVKLPPGGFMPDIAGVQLVYRIDDLYHLAAKAKEFQISIQSHAGAPVKLLVELEKIAAEGAFHEASEILTDLGPDTAQFPEDSLAAKLMLAVALNRAELEDLEYLRFETLATPSLIEMIRALSQRGIMRLPVHMNDQDFGKWLVDYFGGDSLRSDNGTWRPLKNLLVDRFFLRAQRVVAQAAKLDPLSPMEDMNAARKVCFLAIAWSYCTKEPIDPRIPSQKPTDLVSGRPESENTNLLPAVMFYHCRQLNSMLYTHQDKELSVDVLEHYHHSNINRRAWRRKLREKQLRGASLARWEALSCNLDSYFKDLIALCPS